LSDRGGACDSLLAAGQDPLESPAVRGQVEWVAESHGAFLSGDAITRRVASQDIGPDVRAVVQAALDAQAMGLRVGASGGADAEPAAYDTVRRILEERDARYIEHAVVLGTIGRKYRVDFKAAVMASPKVVVRAAIVVIHSSPLEMAERWNFRFRDMGERPRRKRVAVIDGATAWSPDARRTLAPECDGLFGPGDTDGLRDYLARVA